MSWNYRIVRYKTVNENPLFCEEGLALCEVYYTKTGKPKMRSALNYIPLCRAEDTEHDSLVSMISELDLWRRIIMKASVDPENILDDFVEDEKDENKTHKKKTTT